MRTTISLTICALALGCLAALVGQTANVAATGAPADNSTIPGLSGDNQTVDEIRPRVEYALLGPSSQSEGTPPDFTARFVCASAGQGPTVTGAESWYLDVDINAPGWLYIYEHFPAGGTSPGEWIAYKWQLPQGGAWRLGPFTARDSEPEGQHIYAVWFYSQGRWAGDDPDSPHSKLVYWTYRQEDRAGQTIPRPAATTTGPGLPSRLYAFVTRPAVLALGLSLLVMLGLYMYWSYSRRRMVRNGEVLSLPVRPETPAAAPPHPVSARIVLPNGMELRLSGKGRTIGRSDLARALDLDRLALISRQHFEVKLEGEQFYIEDLKSTNGTRLNGEDIGGKGAVSLKDNDIIEPAGAIHLKFRLL